MVVSHAGAWPDKLLLYVCRALRTLTVGVTGGRRIERVMETDESVTETDGTRKHRVSDNSRHERAGQGTRSMAFRKRALVFPQACIT